MANLREKLDNLNCGLCSLTVFRALLRDEVIAALGSLIDELAESGNFNIRKYSEFAAKLYPHGTDLGKYIFRAVCEDDNFYIIGKAQGKVFDSFIENAVRVELDILRQLSLLTPEELQFGYYRTIELPQWCSSDIDFVSEYQKRIENISSCGYGMFAKHTMFILRGGETVPVKFPDGQRLSQLFGYERERNAVAANTLALVEGKPAQNVLLYGDAGTGKSSTVKAVVNEFADRGLRLIELTKEQLRDIPVLIDKLSRDPLRFIIFIDDLTFTSGEDCFGALKAALEGSVSARAQNIAIYATSNRRHLVRESFSERDGDDVHRNDTMQELLSLSARFGLRVNFSRPDKNSYTAIAIKIARENGISLPDDEIALRAEQFAMSSGNGRSPRTAKQFVNKLIIEN